MHSAPVLRDARFQERRRSRPARLRPTPSRPATPGTRSPSERVQKRTSLLPSGRPRSSALIADSKCGSIKSQAKESQERQRPRQAGWSASYTLVRKRKPAAKPNLWSCSPHPVSSRKPEFALHHRPATPKGRSATFFAEADRRSTSAICAELPTAQQTSLVIAVVSSPNGSTHLPHQEQARGNRAQRDESPRPAA